MSAVPRDRSLRTAFSERVNVASWPTAVIHQVRRKRQLESWANPQVATYRLGCELTQAATRRRWSLPHSRHSACPIGLSAYLRAPFSKRGAERSSHAEKCVGRSLNAESPAG